MADYSVSLRRSAVKDMRRLDAKIQARVLRAMESLANDPRPDGCKKLQGSDDAWRIRVGDWRVIYAVDDDAFVVAVEHVRHRSDAYR